MIVFPNSKINIGLQVLHKRSDGFHSLETVFYPVNWCDALEVVTHDDQKVPFMFSQSGLSVAGNTEDNLIYKTWKLVSEKKTLPPLKIHLHKNIPMGAGLGGGSSDAAHFIILLNKKFELGLSEHKCLDLAAEIGSDCPFFIKNTPTLAHGRGNEFSEIRVDLSKYFILIIYPGIHSNTKDAFANLEIRKPEHHLKTLIEKHPIHEWRGIVVNDFEEPIFKKYREIKDLKEQLYQMGAIYASLSGSGSAVYGIFELEPHVPEIKGSQVYLHKPGPKIL